MGIEIYVGKNTGIDSHIGEIIYDAAVEVGWIEKNDHDRYSMSKNIPLLYNWIGGAQIPLLTRTKVIVEKSQKPEKLGYIEVTFSPINNDHDCEQYHSFPFAFESRVRSEIEKYLANSEQNK